MKKIAVYPGSFDPITLGHVDLITRLSTHFDHLIVLVAESADKKSLFTPQERQSLVQKSILHLPRVEVDIFDGLTVDYMRNRSANIIVRGLRAVADFEYEMTMALINKKLANEFETFLVISRPEFQYISSRGVKEVARHKGQLEGLVTDVVAEALRGKFPK